MCKKVLELVSVVADNRYYLGRIKFWDFDSVSHADFISRLGTVPTIIIYAMDIIEEIGNLRKNAGSDEDKFKQLMLQKKYWFLLKICEFPVSHTIN